jgi:hypothetical protein
MSTPRGIERRSKFKLSIIDGRLRATLDMSFKKIGLVFAGICSVAAALLKYAGNL